MHPKRYAVKNVKIIDGTGAAPIEHGYLIVDGQTIEGVGQGELTGFDGEVFDFSGKTIIPGMINCHTHQIGYNGVQSFEERCREPESWLFLRAQKNLMDDLRSGVTYVRDCGSGKRWNLELRDARKAGIIPGPDIVACGQLITMTGGHGGVEGTVADGIDQIRRATRDQIRAGVDQVKTVATGGIMSAHTNPGSPQYDYEELATVAREAHKAGKRVLVHAHGTEGIKNALRAGIESIEHGAFLDDECIEMMVRQGTFLVPTLSAAFWTAYGKNVKLPATSIEKAKRCVEAAICSFQKAHKAGVKIAMGTDAGTPENFHGGSWKELELYVEHGMTPMEALITATKTASEAIERSERYGTLEQGKNADFVVLSRDPLQDITVLRKVDAVYKDGKPVRMED